MLEFRAPRCQELGAEGFTARSKSHFPQQANGSGCNEACVVKGKRDNTWAIVAQFFGHSTSDGSFRGTLAPEGLSCIRRINAGDCYVNVEMAMGTVVLDVHFPSELTVCQRVGLLGDGLTTKTVLHLLGQPVSYPVMPRQRSPAKIAKALMHPINADVGLAALSMMADVMALPHQRYCRRARVWHEKPLPDHDRPCGVRRSFPIWHRILEPQAGAPPALSTQPPLLWSANHRLHRLSSTLLHCPAAGLRLSACTARRNC